MSLEDIAETGRQRAAAEKKLTTLTQAIQSAYTSGEYGKAEMEALRLLDHIRTAGEPDRRAKLEERVGIRIDKALEGGE